MPPPNSNARPRSTAARRGPGAAGRGPGRGPRRGRAYELFVLGELTAGPHHGYLLHAILGKIFGPFRQVSWGALYPLIHRLSQDGLIAAVAEKRAGKAGRQGHERILYRITPAGRQRFRALMQENVPYAAYDTDVFISRLGYFDFVDAQRQTEILEYHRGFLQAQDAYMRDSLRLVMDELEIPEVERARIKWVTEFRLKRIQAELEWVVDALKGAA
jgi:DNA-binding PadR family transcriptional regulator